MTATIAIKGHPFVKEGRALAAGILPGDLIELKSTAGTVGVHSAAAPTYRVSPSFALENEVYAGAGHTNSDISTAYAINDTVKYGVFPPGTEVYAFLKNDANANVAVGDRLMSTGDGKLTKLTGAGVQGVAIALEALNNTAGGAPVRIKVEVL